MSADDPPPKKNAYTIIVTDRQAYYKNRKLLGRNDWNLWGNWRIFWDFQNINYRIEIIQSPLWFQYSICSTGKSLCGPTGNSTTLSVLEQWVHQNLNKPKIAFYK